MKASDIADGAALLALSRTPPVTPTGWSPPWWNRWDFAGQNFPDFPEKVVTAKVRQLAKRGLAQGCFCGCRGDFELSPEGRELVQAQRVS